MTEPTILADSPIQIEFRKIREELESGKTVYRTPRQLISLFGAYRRGYRVNLTVRKTLEMWHFKTVPEFDNVYIDYHLKVMTIEQFQKQLSLVSNAKIVSNTGSPPTESPTAQLRASVDATQRIGMLAAANSKIVSVPPDALISTAITLLLEHDYSQLPVMQGERSVKGVVSWKSIGQRFALGHKPLIVRECMEIAVTIPANTSIFSAIETIVNNDYVLISDGQGKISGLVTTSDLSIQFHQLAEPFLLIGEIENHVRNLIDGHFTVDELKAAKNETDKDRKVEGIEDLTFGEYVRLLQRPDKWAKLKLDMDRTLVTNRLAEVGSIRNDVMHFDPDPLSPEVLAILRKTVQFLRSLTELRPLAPVSAPCDNVAKEPVKNV